MGNCLKTQLKEVVQNDNLRKLGTLILTGDSSNKTKLNFKPSSGNTIVITNLTGNFILDDGTDAGTNIYTSSDSTWGIDAVIPAGHIVEVDNKYHIKEITRQDYGLLYNIPLSELNYCIDLEKVTISGSCFLNELTSILSNLVNLTFYNTINGSWNEFCTKVPNITNIGFSSAAQILPIASLAELSKLETVIWAEMYNENHLEDLVSAYKEKGKLSGNISFVGVTTSNLYFNNQRVGADSTLVWTPNSGDPTKTDVTYNGVTVII